MNKATLLFVTLLCLLISYSISAQVDTELDLGCGTPSMNHTSDQVEYYNGNKIPWSFNLLNIPQAWQEGYRGDGIKIALIDTGHEENNGKKVNRTEFLNLGRSLEFKCFQHVWQYNGYSWTKYLDCADLTNSNTDQCGHGTAISNIIAAPLSSTFISGIAPDCDFVVYKTTTDVVLNDVNDLLNLKDALKDIYNNRASNGIDIVSISLGIPAGINSEFQSIYNSISNYLRLLRESNILVFGAAGTGGGGVSYPDCIWPARDPNVSAVTGLQYYPPGPISSIEGTDYDDLWQYSSCNVCTEADEVEFSLPMEYSEPLSFSHIPSYNINGAERDFGGSSVATCMMAGLTAVVWSSAPWLSADEVLTSLRQTSRLFSLYGNPWNHFGYGVPNVTAAIELLNSSCDPGRFDVSYNLDNVILPIYAEVNSDGFNIHKSILRYTDQVELERAEITESIFQYGVCEQGNFVEQNQVALRDFETIKDENLTQLRITPNPNNGIFTISGLKKGQSVFIFNSKGQKVKESLQSKSSNINFDLTGLKSGLYFVRTENEALKLMISN